MTQVDAQFVLFVIGLVLFLLGGGGIANNCQRTGITLLILGVLFMLPASLMLLLQPILLGLFTLLRLALLGGTP